MPVEDLKLFLRICPTSVNLKQIMSFSARFFLCLEMQLGFDKIANLHASSLRLYSISNTSSLHNFNHSFGIIILLPFT